MIHNLTVWAPFNNTFETPLAEEKDYYIDGEWYRKKSNTEIGGSGYTQNDIPGYRFLNEGPVGPILSLNEDVVRPDSPGTRESYYLLKNPGLKTRGYHHSGACWIKPSAYNYSDWRRVSLGGYSSSSGDEGFYFSLASDGALGVQVPYYHPEYHYWTIEYIETDENTILLDHWYHVAYTLDNDKVSLYVNGEKVKTGILKYYTPVSSRTIYFGNPIDVGRLDATAYIRGEFVGQISDWRIYNETLTDKEVKLLSQGLLAHYPMRGDDRTPNTLIDCSWNSKKNNLTGVTTLVSTEKSFIGHNLKSVKTSTGYYDNINSPVFANLSHDNRTICGWYLLDDFTPNYQTLFYVQTNFGYLKIIIISSTGELQARLSTAEGSYWQLSLPGTELKRGVAENGEEYPIFNHFAVTCKDSLYKFYMNGTLIKEFALEGSVINGRCFLGVSSDGRYVWPGKLSDFRCYATALSDEDIYDLAYPGTEFDKDGACYSAEFIQTTSAETYVDKRGVTRSLHFKEHNSSDQELLVQPDFTIFARKFIEK